MPAHNFKNNPHTYCFFNILHTCIFLIVHSFLLDLICAVGSDKKASLSLSSGRKFIHDWLEDQSIIIYLASNFVIIF